MYPHWLLNHFHIQLISFDLRLSFLAFDHFPYFSFLLVRLNRRWKNFDQNSPKNGILTSFLQICIIWSVSDWFVPTWLWFWDRRRFDDFTNSRSRDPGTSCMGRSSWHECDGHWPAQTRSACRWQRETHYNRPFIHLWTTYTQTHTQTHTCRIRIYGDTHIVTKRVMLCVNVGETTQRRFRIIVSQDPIFYCGIQNKFFRFSFKLNKRSELKENSISRQFDGMKKKERERFHRSRS